MMVAPASKVLNKVIEPLADCMTRESAQRVADFQLDPATAARIRELADKSNEGQLSEEERTEYLAFVEAIDLVGILQARARKLLSIPANS